MMRDAPIFYSAFEDPVTWRIALQAELPDLDVRIHPDVGSADEVKYALVWKQPAGFFSQFRSLKLVTNLGAGVDSLVDRDDLPPIV